MIMVLVFDTIPSHDGMVPHHHLSQKLMVWCQQIKLVKLGGVGVSVHHELNAPLATLLFIICKHYLGKEMRVIYIKRTLIKSNDLFGS